ncbi:MAG: hypothetical protein AAGE85_11500 [Pseudomonadota bacterium]
MHDSRRMLALLAVLFSPPINASVANECLATAIATRAEVQVSDGSDFVTETLFHSAREAAIRHELNPPQIAAVTDDIGWAESGSGFEPGTNFHKLFALGHQYHALLLYFDDVMSNVRAVDSVRFRQQSRAAFVGDYPFGGTAYLVLENGGEKALGLRFDFPDIPTIEVMFDDWREVDGRSLPFLARIDDGNLVFDYRYTSIEISEQPPTWFLDTLPIPEVAALDAYRSERRRTGAACSEKDRSPKDPGPRD